MRVNRTASSIHNPASQLVQTAADKHPLLPQTLPSTSPFPHRYLNPDRQARQEQECLGKLREPEGHGKIVVRFKHTLFPFIGPVELRSVSMNPQMILSLGRSSLGVAFHEY